MSVWYKFCVISGDKTVEIRYCQILNKVLPPEIRVLAWAPVHPEFSARYVFVEICTKVENMWMDLNSIFLDNKKNVAEMVRFDKVEWIR